uniref:Cation channel sperm-associated protein 1 isoform X1 n=1 Tax=Pogona vitticeps TaxID=103695 RepID=A0ABM5F3R3_9SAUR
MNYLTVPTMPSLPQMEKILTKEDQAPTGAPGTSATPVGQGSVVSLSPPPTQEPSTLMAATSMISHPTSRSRDSRTHSKTHKSRRGSKGTYPTHQTKGGGKGQHHHKRKHRRMTLRELVSRAWRETVPYLVALRSIIYNLTQSMFFDIFIGTVVAINNILLVAQTFAVVEIRGEWFFSAMDPVFLSVYVVEAILKIVALGVDYFRDPWNDTDFFIMIMTVLDFLLPLFISSRQGNRGNTVTLFRVLKICKGIRAIRAIRFLLTLRVMENVREVTSTFMLSCQSIGAIIIVMFTLLFMSSVVMRDMFCDADPAHFGDIFKTIFTLFQLFTLDDWSLIYLTCYDAGGRSREAAGVSRFEKSFGVRKRAQIPNPCRAAFSVPCRGLVGHPVACFEGHGGVDGPALTVFLFSLPGAWYVIIFLIVYILVQYFLLLNLVIAVLVDNFQVALLKRQELQKQKKRIQPEDSTKEDGPSSKPAEKGKKREEREEEFFRRMVMEKYGNLELAEREWQLLYKYFQLMTAIETHQQQFHSQSSTTDKILDTFFETAQQDDLPK